MKRIMLFLFSLFLLIGIFLPSNVYAVEKQKIKIHYFGTDSCQRCQEAKSYLSDFKSKVSTTMSSDLFDGIEIIYHETISDDIKLLQQSYAKTYNVPSDKASIVPSLYIGDKYIIDIENIKKELPSLIMAYYNGHEEYKEIQVDLISKTEASKTQEDKLNSFTPLGVLSAGLLDGFNPCAIAMLLFFITFLSMSGRENKSILFVGLSYVLGTFITYFGIGIGLFRFAYIFTNAKPIMIGIYTVTIVLSIILAIQNFIEYKSTKNGDLTKVKLQLPKKIKHTIQNYIRKNSSNKAIYLSAFVAGVVISCLEFFCTGQIYLPTIVYVLSAKTSIAKAIMYLGVYNLAFVLPLIAICIAIYYGKKVMDISQILVNKLYLIKLIVGIFFVAVTVVMILQLMKII